MVYKVFTECSSREREREELRGGAADFERRKRSRFGGRFDKYFEDGRQNEEIPKGTTGAADIRHWDVAPPAEYFSELARVSKNQIIWGGNYFDLPPTRCFLIWRKIDIPEDFSMSMAEYAWTSLNENAKVFDFQTRDSARFHPTQKPVQLYAWIYRLFAKPGYKILDTHLGSGSSRIAAYDAGLDFWGYEISEDYFAKQEKRFAEYTAQESVFRNLTNGWGTQQDLFE